MGILPSSSPNSLKVSKLILCFGQIMNTNLNFFFCKLEYSAGKEKYARPTE